MGAVYKYTKLIIYHILVILTGIPVALIWGLSSGCTVFSLVWLYQPWLRVFVTCVYACAPLFTAPMQATLTPLIDVLGHICQQIRIKSCMGWISCQETYSFRVRDKAD